GTRPAARGRPEEEGERQGRLPGADPGASSRAAQRPAWRRRSADRRLDRAAGDRPGLGTTRSGWAGDAVVRLIKCTAQENGHGPAGRSPVWRVDGLAGVNEDAAADRGRGGR